jgi:hypothetical protein
MKDEMTIVLAVLTIISSIQWIRYRSKVEEMKVREFFDALKIGRLAGENEKLEKENTLLSAENSWLQERFEKGLPIRGDIQDE